MQKVLWVSATLLLTVVIVLGLLVFVVSPKQVTTTARRVSETTQVSTIEAVSVPIRTEDNTKSDTNCDPYYDSLRACYNRISTSNLDIFEREAAEQACLEEVAGTLGSRLSDCVSRCANDSLLCAPPV